jgi:hypothetical protein
VPSVLELERVWETSSVLGLAGMLALESDPSLAHLSAFVSEQLLAVPSVLELERVWETSSVLALAGMLALESDPSLAHLWATLSAFVSEEL